MVLKALHRKMLHRHLHEAPVDRSPLALVLQLIPKYFQHCRKLELENFSSKIVELDLKRIP